MIANALVCASVPVTDLERARRFYGEGLGLADARLGDDQSEVFYLARAQTMLHLYERPSPSAAAEHTVATFLVENLVEKVSTLRGRGIRFEEYDLPDLTTNNGVHSRESGFKAAWVKDPDGNILSFEQLA